jgi:hypothetical protein
MPGGGAGQAAAKVALCQTGSRFETKWRSKALGGLSNQVKGAKRVEIQ